MPIRHAGRDERDSATGSLDGSDNRPLHRSCASLKQKVHQIAAPGVIPHQFHRNQTGRDEKAAGGEAT